MARSPWSAAAILALGIAGCSSTQRLVGRLKSRDPVVRRRAALGLALVKERAHLAVPALAAALENDDDARVRLLAAFSLGRLPADRSVALPALRSALADPDEQLRAQAAVSLAMVVGQSAGVSPGSDARGDGTGGHGLRRMSTARMLALGEVMRRVDLTLERDVLFLAASCVTEAFYERCSAQGRDAQEDPASAPSALPPGLVRALRTTLDDEWPKARAASALALAALAPDAKEAVHDIVRRALGDESADVRKACAIALLVLGWDSTAAAQALARLAEADPDGEVRKLAASVLAFIEAE